jgi:hypothetical protein
VVRGCEQTFASSFACSSRICCWRPCSSTAAAFSWIVLLACTRKQISQAHTQDSQHHAHARDGGAGAGGMDAEEPARLGEGAHELGSLLHTRYPLAKIGSCACVRVHSERLEPHAHADTPPKDAQYIPSDTRKNMRHTEKEAACIKCNLVLFFSSSSAACSTWNCCRTMATCVVLPAQWHKHPAITRGHGFEHNLTCTRTHDSTSTY